MKDMLKQREIANRCFHNPKTRHLVIEDDRFADAVNFGVVAMVNFGDEMRSYFDRMHGFLAYHTAVHGGWPIAISVAQCEELLRKVCLTQIVDRSVLVFWRYWVIFEIEEYDMAVDAALGNFKLKEEFLYALKPKLNAIESRCAVVEGRNVVDYFAPDYTPRPIECDPRIARESLNMCKSVMPALFSPEVAFTG